jgi:hypothetical protein
MWDSWSLWWSFVYKPAPVAIVEETGPGLLLYLELTCIRTCVRPCEFAPMRCKVEWCLCTVTLQQILHPEHLQHLNTALLIPPLGGRAPADSGPSPAHTPSGHRPDARLRAQLAARQALPPRGHVPHGAHSPRASCPRHRICVCIPSRTRPTPPWHNRRRHQV